MIRTIIRVPLPAPVIGARSSGAGPTRSVVGAPAVTHVARLRLATRVHRARTVAGAVGSRRYWCDVWVSAL